MAITRRQLLFSVAAAAAQRPSANRPNILLIVADDQGWGDLSVHGNTNLSTPHIDSLARDGALFDRFYACPVCAPMRAEFLTGRYHARGGVRGVSTGTERLNLGELTIAEVFQRAGYATGIFGKWHNGSQPPYHPNYRGFDEFYGFTSGHWGQYFTPELDHNGEMVRGNGYIIDDLTDHAREFMAKHQARPFFCYVPFNSPHSPMQVPDRFYDKFKDAKLEMRAKDPAQEDLPFTRAALAMCENVDWNVGRLLGEVNKLRLEQETIVIYISDNGPNSWRWNGGMKGRKGSTDEGGVRVPCLMRWPGKISPGTKVSQIAGALDLFPTLADLAAITVQPPKPFDGRSLKALLTTKNAEWKDRMIFSQQNRQVSVRTQRYRLDAAGKLFDMVSDPGQTRDISAAEPTETKRLLAAVADFKRDVFPFVGPDERPYPVGFSATTWLPARDGEGQGGIARSAKAPNCSFFTHWTSKEDRMTWNVEVLKAGTYTAELYYTCPAADIGSTVELTLGASKLIGKINVAHDPPLEGAKDDRVDRGQESFVKAFKPLRLGSVKLEKGQGTLTLQATEITGRQVADVRYVILRRS